MGIEKAAFIIGQTARLVNTDPTDHEHLKDAGGSKAFEGTRKRTESVMNPDSFEDAAQRHTVPKTVYEQAARAARDLGIVMPEFNPDDPTFSIESAMAAAQALKRFEEEYADTPGTEGLREVVRSNSIFATLAH